MAATFWCPSMWCVALWWCTGSCMSQENFSHPARALVDGQKKFKIGIHVWIGGYTSHDVCAPQLCVSHHNFCVVHILLLSAVELSQMKSILFAKITKLIATSISLYSIYHSEITNRPSLTRSGVGGRLATHKHVHCYLKGRTLERCTEGFCGDVREWVCLKLLREHVCTGQLVSVTVGMRKWM